MYLLGKLVTKCCEESADSERCVGAIKCRNEGGKGRKKGAPTSCVC